MVRANQDSEERKRTFALADKPPVPPDRPTALRSIHRMPALLRDAGMAPGVNRDKCCSELSVLTFAVADSALAAAVTATASVVVFASHPECDNVCNDVHKPRLDFSVSVAGRTFTAAATIVTFGHWSSPLKKVRNRIHATFV